MYSEEILKLFTIGPNDNSGLGEIGSVEDSKDSDGGKLRMKEKINHERIINNTNTFDGLGQLEIGQESLEHSK
ncbi:hypothetical protein [Fusobacterium necrophorum]|uniref:hypothetical protein n=1 Tax=Fusobacterium necrophorum TaxID=859 RepID=UPI00254A1358|nr:hypothetical protein [Fusobacterium necrophorum]MDK4476173.1 hypothetical protein [Fusobacterium necrophorum]